LKGESYGKNDDYAWRGALNGEIWGLTVRYGVCYHFSAMRKGRQKMFFGREGLMEQLETLCGRW
jgi:hypothetical protein